MRIGRYSELIFGIAEIVVSLRQMSLRERIVLVGFLILCSLGIYAKEKHVPTIIRSWRLTEGFITDSVGIDTSYIDYPMHDVINNYSISNSYNGNLVSPIESKIYFDRQEKTEFLFAHAYMPYLLTPEDVRFYNTTTPYSSIAYKKGFTTYREENDLDFIFTGNLNRRTNLGLSMNYLNAVGHYSSQAGKRFNGSVWGSYSGDHYSCQGAVTFNTLSNFENGGLQEGDYLDGSLKSSDIPVRLNAMSGFKYFSGFFNHRYSICVERERKVTEDSVTTDYIPVTTFLHTIEVNQSTKRYVEEQTLQNFYADTYFNRSRTRDTANVLTIRNTLSVTFEEEFNKWLRFGATVFAINEFQRYAYSVPDRNAPFNETFGISLNEILSNPLRLQTDTTFGYKWTNNTRVGGSLYKKQGKYVHYGFTGDVCVAGYKLGEFQIRGNVDGAFRIGKDTMTIVAEAYIKNEEPDYFLQHYRSNHYCWENDFQKIYRMYAGGTLSYPTRYVRPSIRIGFENIMRYIYFDSNGMPIQHDGHVQVLSVDARLNFRTKHFALDNNVVWQMSSSAILPLPDIALYHNIYYYGCWFRALDAQIGVDMRYNTAYYAPLLNPATGQFCIQNEVKTGNYPILNVYANFYVRSIRLKLFAHFTHFNQYFMKHKNYYSMPGYPLNPPVFRAGLAWHFYR
ncbi:MAG: putative porin [Paludibacter sp.]|nr:putative porin [Bacteroidales bacterium]MCM1069981.1 putative porin [Prevotella sp.]MCM1354741.1 putative porin [Bacteroides sp.]MCM1443585.1 putative porin [Muribaculum sp.]MCM1482660.1 putative porin [Paludibacter sp.]